MKTPVLRTLIAIPALIALFAGQAWAEGVDKAVEEKLRKTLTNPEMGLVVEAVSASEIPGMVAVQFERGPLVYATPDGKYFLTGDVYSTDGAVFVNVTEQRRDALRKERIASVAKEDMIIFSPEGETKAYVNVFTDITCGYCRKLHQEVPEYNRRGIEVRYLAYPRAGLGTPGYSQLVTAWCSDKPQDTLTKLKMGQNVATQSCADNPVSAQFALGQELGVRGTPAIVTQDGTLIPGYRTPDQLSGDLGLN